MKHRRAVSLLGVYWDGELSPAQSADLEAHLRQCSSCQVALAGIRLDAARLQSWSVPDRAAQEEQAFVDRLVRSLPAHSPGKLSIRSERPAQAGPRAYLLPAGLVLSGAFIQAAAVLTVALGVLAAIGAFGGLEEQLGPLLGGAVGITGGTLTQLTWAGWLWSQLSALLGPTAASATAWLDWLLGGLTPAIVFIALQFVVFVMLAGWAGLRLQRQEVGR